MHGNIAPRSNRRQTTRYAFNGLVPARIVLPGVGDIEAIYIDVSRSGLGILCSSLPLGIGDSVELFIDGQPPINLEVCWIRIPLPEVFAEVKPMLRLGLRSHLDEVNLVECFDLMSCLDR